MNFSDHIFLLYLDKFMHPFKKIRGLVILDWYVNGRMETISTKKKGNKRLYAPERAKLGFFYFRPILSSKFRQLHFITKKWRSEE